jgi:phage baseplate assembly protein W
VEESIRIILGTARGERVMRPDFGANLNRLSFSPNNTSTAGLAIFYVQEALAKWEPRIELLDVDAEQDGNDANTLLITVDYRIVSTNTEHNLVYPFYLGSK